MSIATAHGSVRHPPLRRRRRAQRRGGGRSLAWGGVLLMVCALLCVPLAAQPAAAADGVLSGGTVLRAGSVRFSQNLGVMLKMQNDGNLVLYRVSGSVPLWATGTHSVGAWATIQSDGNLVVYSRSGTPIWHTHTGHAPGAFLKVQDDQKLVLYRPDGVVEWQTLGPNVNIELQRRVDVVLRNLRAAGYRPKVDSGYRSFAEQQVVYERGTGVAPGKSWHNYGLAADIVVADSRGRSTWPDPSPFWAALGNQARAQGLIWGGDWKSSDRPHVEYHPGYTAGQAGLMRSTYDSGGLRAVWNRVGLP